MALRSEVSIFCWPPLIPIFKKKVEQNRMILSIFISKNVFGVCLECFSLDGSLGLQVCPKNFFSSAIYSPLVALSFPILKIISQKIFFRPSLYLWKISRKSLLRRLWPITRYMSVDMRKKLVISLIVPKFLFASPVYSGTSKGSWDKLKLAFNSCARYVF